MATSPALPKTIVVGPFDYTITVDTDAINVKQVEERSMLYGCTSRQRGEIHLHPDNSPSVMRETFLHEVLHTVTNVAGLDAELATEDEERFVRRVSPILLDVLRRNPKAVQYLLAP